MRSLSASAPRRRPFPTRQRLAGAELALGEGHREVAVEAHHLAGRAHLRPEHGVDAGEAGERKHRLLDADVAELGRRRSKALQRLAAIMRAAIAAIGLPITLATNGTVREARGFTSSTKIRRRP